MVVRRVALLEQLTCASAGYLKSAGTPKTLQAFQQHRAVNFIGSNGKTWPFEFIVDGALRRLQLRGIATVSHAGAYHACCLAGLGFVQVPRYHVAPLLADGTLVEVLKRWRPPPMPVSLLYPHHRQLSPRVRVFVD